MSVLSQSTGGNGFRSVVSLILAGTLFAASQHTWPAIALPAEVAHALVGSKPENYSSVDRASQLVIPARIHDIQGLSHLSPLSGTLVTGVPGIVIATRPSSFYIQDPSPDADDNTSEGLLVVTGTAPGVAIGDSVEVTGTVTEFRPGGTSDSSDLTVTGITGVVSIAIVSSGNSLPPATLIGLGGRVPPARTIENDALGNVETLGILYDPSQDALDFYESLEGMRIVISDAVAVGSTSSLGELPVVSNFGGVSDSPTARGGVYVRAGDFNPERLIVDDALIGAALPRVSVGAQASGPITAVVDYSFGNFKFLATDVFSMTASAITKEVTSEAGVGEIMVATFNVENLDANDPQSKFDGLAEVVVTNLKNPDLLAVEEVQDNNGATNDAVTDASATWARLINAIQSAGGPSYSYRDIAPVDGLDGGEPGGNIRQGFLFRTDRGLAFVDRAGGTATAAVAVTATSTGPVLTLSPGRIAPGNAAFSLSRKPLAGEFAYAGQTLFVIANHFVSKGSDQPLFGRFQPPVLASESKRNQQASLVADFVNQIRSRQPNAFVIVLGDLNDFEFSQPLDTLTSGTGLVNLTDRLPPAERYTYVFDGNSQALDHILVSTGLRDRAVVSSDIVHVNAEFLASQRVSDHDPQLARIRIQAGPTDCPTQTLPYCIKLDGLQKGGVSSRFVITSVSASPTAFQVQYFGVTGSTFLGQSGSLNAGAALTVSLAGEAGLAAGFAGYALVFSDNPLLAAMLAPLADSPATPTPTLTPMPTPVLPARPAYLPLVSRPLPTPTATPLPPPTEAPTGVPSATSKPTAIPTEAPTAQPTSPPIPTATRFVVPTVGSGQKPWCAESTGTRRVGAICMDGSRSSATGTGACSSHGGVRCWLGVP